MTIEGFAIQYESYEHEDFELEVQDLSLFYNPLFDRNYSSNLFEKSGHIDLFRDVGTSFYEVDSRDFEKFIEVSNLDLDALKGGSGDFNRIRSSNRK